MSVFSQEKLKYSVNVTYHSSHTAVGPVAVAVSSNCNSTFYICLQILSFEQLSFEGSHNPLPKHRAGRTMSSSFKLYQISNELLFLSMLKIESVKRSLSCELVVVSIFEDT